MTTTLTAPPTAPPAESWKLVGAFRHHGGLALHLAAGTSANSRDLVVQRFKEAFYLWKTQNPDWALLERQLQQLAKARAELDTSDARIQELEQAIQADLEAGQDSSQHEAELRTLRSTLDDVSRRHTSLTSLVAATHERARCDWQKHVSTIYHAFRRQVSEQLDEAKATLGKAMAKLPADAIAAVCLATDTADWLTEGWRSLVPAFPRL
jgi:hypothetical protein